MRIVHAVVLTGALVLTGCDWFIDASTRIERAEERLAAGDDRAAFIELQNAVRQEPKNIDARLMLVRLSLRLGDARGAEKELELARTNGAKPQQTAELQADVLLSLGQFQRVLDEIDSGAIALSGAARSTYRGLAYQGLGDPTRALAEFDEAVASDPSYVRARLSRVDVLMMVGKSDAALDELELVLQANGKNPHALLKKGVLLTQRGEFAQGVSTLESARANAAGELSAAESVALLAALTEGYLGSGDLASAEKTHAVLNKSMGESPLTRVLAARLALAKRDYASAVAEAQRAVNASPELLQAKVLLGVSLLANGNLNQAEVQLAEAARMAPDNLEVRKLLAKVNLQLNRPEVALGLLQPIQQANLDDPQLDALLGAANLQRGNSTEGIAMLERSVAAQPDASALKLDLAMAYVAAGQNDKALALLKAMPADNSRRTEMLMRVLATTQGPQAVRAEVDSMVAADPQNADVLNLAGTLYAQTGDLERSREMFARSLKARPASVSTLLSMAEVEAASGNYKAAATAAERAIAADPNSSRTKLAAAKLSMKGNDVPGAVKLLEEVRARDPNAVEARILLAHAYLQQQKPKEADALIGQVEAQARDKPVIADAVARLYLSNGRFEEALRWFRTAADLDASNPAYLLGVARTQRAMGNEPLALETLEAVVAAHPDSVDGNAELILHSARAGEAESARKRMAALKATRPEDPVVARIEGDLEMMLKEYRAAASAYEKSHRRLPTGATAMKLYRARKLARLPEPSAPLEEWLRQRPQDIAVRMGLAEAYAEENQVDRAIEQYELCVQGERPAAMALNNLAWLYHQKGDARAMETARRAYAAAPKNPSVADTYGWILVNAGKAADAMPILQQAVADAGGQSMIRYHYAVALAKVGQREAALRELEALKDASLSRQVAADVQKLRADLGG